MAIDREFLNAFENCSLKEFPHRDHIRVAWSYLQENALPEAMIKMRDGIKKFAVHVGKTNLYHETITLAYVLIISDRIAQGGRGADWNEFSKKNPDLFRWKPSVLDEYYSAEVLASDLAKASFLWVQKI